MRCVLRKNGRAQPRGVGRDGESALRSAAYLKAGAAATRIPRPCAALRA